MTARTRSQLLSLFTTGNVMDQVDFQDVFDSFLNLTGTSAQVISSDVRIDGTFSAATVPSWTVTNFTASDAAITNLTATSVSAARMNTGRLNRSVIASINAVGSVQGQAVGLPSELVAVFGITTSAADGVMASAHVGRTWTIFNRASSPLKLYPETGAQINALGTNAYIVVSASGCLSLSYLTSTQAYSHGRNN